MDLNVLTGLPYQVDDLAMRLSGSVIRYHERPFYVSSVEDRTLFGLMMDTGKNVHIMLPDEGIDVRPVPLGYVNTDRAAIYCRRLPHRRYKQGLCAANLDTGGAVNSELLLCTPYMAKCIMNDYPNLTEALHQSKVRGHTVAFHRYWSVLGLADDNSELYYRGHKVGSADITNGEHTLLDKFIFLAEELALCVQ